MQVYIFILWIADNQIYLNEKLHSQQRYLMQNNTIKHLTSNRPVKKKKGELVKIIIEDIYLLSK